MSQSPYVQPQVTISTPLQPPPQQLSTADGTIQGNIDGMNPVFWWSIYFDFIQVFRNGNLLTQGTDYGSGPTAISFFPNSIPQPGDVITIKGYGTI